MPSLAAEDANLEPDEAAADDHDLAGVAEPRLEVGGVGDRPEITDPVEFGAADRDPARARAGGDDEALEVEHRAAGQHDPAGSAIDPDNAVAKTQLDPVVGENSLVVHQESLRADLVEQKIL
ncbi:hypothetical protein AB7M50_003513 [Bradyrhizobium elkanii]